LKIITILFQNTSHLSHLKFKLRLSQHKVRIRSLLDWARLYNQRSLLLLVLRSRKRQRRRTLIAILCRLLIQLQDPTSQIVLRFKRPKVPKLNKKVLNPILAYYLQRCLKRSLKVVLRLRKSPAVLAATFLRINPRTF
jgi:hypothetical protein